MKFSLSTLLPLLPLVFANPAIDPLTVTSLSPAQSTAFASAQLPIISSFTANPSFTSVLLALATDPAFLSINEELNGVAGSMPSGAAAYSSISKLVEALPTPARDMYMNLINAEVSALSSVVNEGRAAPTGVPRGVGVVGGVVGAVVGAIAVL